MGRINRQKVSVIHKGAMTPTAAGATLVVVGVAAAVADTPRNPVAAREAAARDEARVVVRDMVLAFRWGVK